MARLLIGSVSHLDLDPSLSTGLVFKCTKYCLVCLCINISEVPVLFNVSKRSESSRPTKEPDQRSTTGTKTKSLFRDGEARKPYPFLWRLHITVTWDYPTGVNVACVQTPHPLRKNPIFLEGRGGGGSCTQARVTVTWAKN